MFFLRISRLVGGWAGWSFLQGISRFEVFSSVRGNRFLFEPCWLAHIKYSDYILGLSPILLWYDMRIRIGGAFSLIFASLLKLTKYFPFARLFALSVEGQNFNIWCEERFFLWNLRLNLHKLQEDRRRNFLESFLSEKLSVMCLVSSSLGM